MKRDIRFPIGQFEPTDNLSLENRLALIDQIPEIAKKIRSVTKHLNNDQLSIPYRNNGWTIKQIIHHLADNDMNAYIRFKRALTEDEPMSASYQEDLWAELPDYQSVPIENSILLLETLHVRFHFLLSGLQPENFNRKLRTELLGTITLDIALQRFLWHNFHHIAQINNFLISRGWIVQ